MTQPVIRALHHDTTARTRTRTRTRPGVQPHRRIPARRGVGHLTGGVMPPLSDHDRTALKRIEVHLSIDDPDLALLLAIPSPAPHRRLRTLLIVGATLSILAAVLLAVLLAVLR